MQFANHIPNIFIVYLFFQSGGHDGGIYGWVSVEGYSFKECLFTWANYLIVHQNKPCVTLGEISLNYEWGNGDWV